jgi:hypothetical protein
MCRAGGVCSKPRSPFEQAALDIVRQCGIVTNIPTKNLISPETQNPKATRRGKEIQNASEGGLVSTQVAVEKVRPDLTIEKWPAIWRPSKSHNVPEARTLERTTTLKDGRVAKATVEVGFTQLGNLTTEDQRTYYALMKQWEEHGRSPEYTYFSTRKLARILKKTWGTNVIHSTTESLRRLRTTPIMWTNSYHNADTGEELEILDTFTILADLKIVRRKIDGHVTKEAGYFHFHDFILKNLLANHTKPVRLDVILGFRSDIAQLLYTHIDLILARNDHYERRTKELFDDLGLPEKAYRKPSDRKRKLEKALAELQKVSLSTGILDLAAIEKTKDEKDYKVVFRKTKKLSISEQTIPAEPNKIFEIKNKPFRVESPLASQAVELVTCFYKLFHGVERPYPVSREIAHAISLISNHGIERAKYIVNFSRSAAELTNYSPQTFGGILQYTSRAMKEFDYYERLREIANAETAVREAREQRELAESRSSDESLSRLSEGEYQQLRETVVRDLGAQFPRAMETGGKLFESAIKARMARIMAESKQVSLDPAHAPESPHAEGRPTVA